MSTWSRGLCECCLSTADGVRARLGHADDERGPDVCDACATAIADASDVSECPIDLRDAVWLDAFEDRREGLASEDEDATDNARPEPDGCHFDHLRSPCAGPPQGYGGPAL